MSLCDQRKRNDGNPNGKFEPVAAPGVQQFSPQEHKGYCYTVGRRKVGVTVKRVQYSVSIQTRDGRQVRYLDNFSNMQSAQAAARDWIDTAFQLAKLEKAREQARRVREAKIREAMLARIGA
jgi:hypothetical protein